MSPQKTTADGQLARTFCACVRGNKSRYHEVAVFCKCHSKEKNQTAVECRYTNRCYHKSEFTHHFPTTLPNRGVCSHFLSRISLMKMDTTATGSLLFSISLLLHWFRLAEQPIRVIFLSYAAVFTSSTGADLVAMVWDTLKKNSSCRLADIRPLAWRVRISTQLTTTLFNVTQHNKTHVT